MCSTPFGINGTNSADFRKSCLKYSLVLNAFRHQRNKQHRKQTPPTCCRLCAQRLSASTEQTANESRYRCDFGNVLNAFRHQRNKQRAGGCGSDSATFACSTPFGINGTNSRVALRFALSGRKCAQRLSASTEQTVAVFVYFRSATACSTPFGINGTNRV